MAAWAPVAYCGSQRPGPVLLRLLARPDPTLLLATKFGTLLRCAVQGGCARGGSRDSVQGADCAGHTGGQDVTGLSAGRPEQAQGRGQCETEPCC